MGEKWGLGSEMISFGAGVNSVAMVVMLAGSGWRGPIVFADTGGERPETYCYLEYFERSFLEGLGMGITRVSPAEQADLYDDKRLGGLADTLEEYCLKRGIIPLLSARWCSVQWKRNPLENWRKRHGIEKSLVGISASEPRRIRDDAFVGYPLYEEHVTRGGCRRIIEEAGLEAPIKSGCFFCPGQALAQWRRLYYDHPELYERAAVLEENASERCQKWATLDPHGMSLREHARRRWEGQMQMDLSRWLPCACSV